MVIELRVVQFLSEIRLVILNQTCAQRSFDFEITQFNYHNKFQAKNRNRDECDIHTYIHALLTTSHRGFSASTTKVIQACTKVKKK